MVHNAASIYVEKANKASRFRISIQAIEKVLSKRITHVNQVAPILCMLCLVSPISPNVYSLELSFGMSKMY